MKASRLGQLWHRIAVFFEHGDLTPLAVIISVAHYGPVLHAHGENWLVAWVVGATIDLLHFRSVRRLFQSHHRNSIVGHALIATVTTLMAVGYHLRFYAGDWLLALPIPIGIAILAQHAASRPIDGRVELVKLFRNRVKSVVKIARRLESRLVAIEMERKVAERSAETSRQELEAERARWQEAESARLKLAAELEIRKEAGEKLEATEKERDGLKREAAGREATIVRLKEQLATAQQQVKVVEHFNPLVLDIGRMMAGDETTQAEIARRHNVSEAEVSRMKGKLNGRANG